MALAMKEAMKDKIELLTQHIMEKEGITLEEARLMCSQLLHDLYDSLDEFSIPQYMLSYDGSED
jgi:hypothetical protein